MNIRRFSKCWTKTLLVLTGSLLVSGSWAQTQEFQNTREALYALDHMGECKCDTHVRAYRYFRNHSDESIPVLTSFVLLNKQRAFVGISALCQIKDERVPQFLITLLQEELERRNGPGGDGQLYDRDGLIRDIVQALGNYGAKRAVPWLEKVSYLQNYQNPNVVTEALCKLGDLSIDKLYELHSKSVEELGQIASSNEYDNPKFSIDVYDWIIRNFADRKALVEKSHFGKATAFYNAGEYEKALSECEILKNGGRPHDSDNWHFVVDHRSYSLSEMIALLKTKLSMK